MKRIETVAIGVIVILAVIVTSVAVFDLLAPPKSNQSNTSFPFVEQPVVDVIVPALSREQGSGNNNIPLNVTAGQVVSLAVYVYSTVNLNVSVGYKVLTGPTTNNSSPDLLDKGSFSPETLSIGADGKGITNMTFTISPRAYTGQYNMVVSAVNLDNSSQFWGDFVQVNVSA